MKKPILVLLTLVYSSSSVALLLPDPSPLDRINREQMRSELSFLASDEMKGRDVGSPENEVAARYLAYRFETIGLEPPYEGSYFQTFDLVQASLGDKNSFHIASGGTSWSGELRKEFYPAIKSSSGRARGPVVFAGFGITAPELAYDEYGSFDVEGKIVLVFTHEPGEDDPASPFEGLVQSDYGRELHKILNAQRRGARAVLLVPDTANHDTGNFRRAAGRAWPADPKKSRYQLEVRRSRVKIPALHISSAVAARLLEPSGEKTESLQQRWEKGELEPFQLSPEVSLDTSLEAQVTKLSNVVGLLRGSDPQLRDEVVVVGAHFDHVSGRDDRHVFNGADDNASGTVGVLEMAEAFKAQAQPPRRSLLFAHFNAEEKGLLGSYFYTDFPLFPLEKTVAMFQMDMIGRNEEVSDPQDRRFRQLEVQSAAENNNAVNLLGATRSPDLKALVEDTNRQIGLKIRFRYDNHPIGLLRRSDHWPFLNLGVPVLFFHTGLHPDYHRPTDTPDRINFEKLEQVVRLVYLTAKAAADAQDSPRFVRFGRKP